MQIKVKQVSDEGFIELTCHYFLLYCFQCENDISVVSKLIFRTIKEQGAKYLHNNTV